MNKFSVLIINYNSTLSLTKLLSSLEKINKLIDEIIIIDNNSDSVNQSKLRQINHRPYIKIHYNKENIGFAKAVNQGIKLAITPYILLLNPDTLLIDNSIIGMYKYQLQNPNIGVIGGKIKKTGRDLYQTTATNKPGFMTALFEFTNLKKIFPNNFFHKHFWVELNNKTNRPIGVSSLCGAFLIIKKYLSNGLLNLFDENYFLYLEDIDFGLQNNTYGYRVVFYPMAVIEHIGGVSSMSKYKTDLKAWYQSRKYFFLKHCNIIEGVVLYILFELEEKLLTTYHHLKHEPTY